MADLSKTAADLAAIQKQVDAAAKVNAKLAQTQLDERNAALQAAAKAGLSVDAGALPDLGAASANHRYLTLVALLEDCQRQIEQIGMLTG